MFEQTFLAPPARTRRAWTVVVSFAGQVALVGIAILLPLIYSDTLPRAFLNAPRLLPPAPPGAPKPPAHVKIVHTSRAPVSRQGLVAPSSIPPRAQMIVDDAPRVEQATSGFFVQGGSEESGPVHSFFRDLAEGVRPPVAAPPPPAPKPPERVAAATPAPARIKQGGDVQAARLLHQVVPQYPPLAKAARIQGVVKLEAVIGTDGRMRQLRVLSGHPLLVPAAVEAVRQWTYRPTLLNSDPVEVLTTIDVNFTLGQ